MKFLPEEGYKRFFVIFIYSIIGAALVPKNSPSPIANYPIKREWYRDTMEMKAYAQNYNVGAYVALAYSGVREFFGGVADDISIPSYEKGHLVDTTAESKGIPSGSLIGPKTSAGSMAGGEVTRPGRYGLVLVYLNGSYIPADEAVFTVLSLPLSEVESMIYVSGVSAAPFQPSFDSGDVSPYPVLMVRTKPDSRGKSLPPNVSMDYPLGWPRCFLLLSQNPYYRHSDVLCRHYYRLSETLNIFL